MNFNRFLAQSFVLLLACGLPGAWAATPAPGPELLRSHGIDRIVFATRTAGKDGHWYANFGYSYRNTDPRLEASQTSTTLFGERGRLCVLDLRTSQAATLVDDPRGAIRDPQVDYEGRRILFSWRKGGTPNYLLYEIGADGRGLRQLTFGPYDDIEPSYLPDGGIVFASSRSRRWVNCLPTPVATLFRCDGDGRNIRMLSANIEQDNTPWMLPDGRLLYTRWEYIDRSQMVYHHLWTMNPDGTGQRVYYGNLNPGHVFSDAKPVPGTRQVVATFGERHGESEHAGQLAFFREDLGPDAPGGMTLLSPPVHGRDPYPVAADCILFANGRALCVRDGQGRTRTIFTFPDAAGDLLLQEPRPLVARRREPVLAQRADLAQAGGRLLVQNVYAGRRMEGVEPGEIKNVLVLENLPRPVNRTNVAFPFSLCGTFQLNRVLGLAPVQPDGSFYLEVPANRALQLVLLDGQNRSVKRMQSFLTVMPGETLGCTGCHESRAAAPLAGAASRIQATRQAPLALHRPASIPEIFDFARDIQPILDRHCARCHNPGRRAGGVSLSGDKGPVWSLAYYELTVRKQFFVGGSQEKSGYPPRAIGDSVSPLLWKMTGQPRDVRLIDAFNSDFSKFPRLEATSSTAHAAISLAPAELDLVRFWINAGAVYPGTYGALGDSGGIGWLNGMAFVDNVSQLPRVRQARAVLASRCGACHQGDRALPATPADNLRVDPWQPDGPTIYSGWLDSVYDRPAVRTFARHRIDDLSRPEDSLRLRAPLARAAGGDGTCRDGAGRPVFATTADPGYQALLAALLDVKGQLDRRGRYDTPGFIPDPSWFREMKRYGILPPDFVPGPGPFDAKAVEERYWEAMWWRPGLKEQWGPEASSPVF